MFICAQQQQIFTSIYISKYMMCDVTLFSWIRLNPECAQFTFAGTLDWQISSMCVCVWEEKKPTTIYMICACRSLDQYVMCLWTTPVPLLITVLGEMQKISTGQFSHKVLVWCSEKAAWQTGHQWIPLPSSVLWNNRLLSAGGNTLSDKSWQRHNILY